MTDPIWLLIAQGHGYEPHSPRCARISGRWCCAQECRARRER